MRGKVIRRVILKRKEGFPKGEAEENEMKGEFE